MQSLFSAVLVILIILLVVIVFVPAYLERLSKRNRAERDGHAADLRARELEARAQERQVIPYARGKSAHFRDRAAAAREQLAALLAEVAQAQTGLGAMRCPEVFNYLLPIQHFALSPHDAAAIVADRRRLNRLRNQLRVVDGAAAAAQAAVAELAALPDTLAAARRETAAQLDGVESALRAERAAGVAELADLERDASRARALLGEVAASGGDLPGVDAGAVALEGATAIAATLEERTSAIAAARARLDERLQRTRGEFDDLQAGAKGRPEAPPPPQLRPVVRRAAALLNETAPAHRRRRDFAAAEAAADTAARLVALARDLGAADAVARLLAEHDDGVSLAQPIAAVRAELADLLATAEAFDESPPSAAREAALVARAATLRRRAEELAAQQNEIIAGLEREAAAARDRLARQWQASRQLLPLAADDPLSRRYTKLIADADAARRHPDALAQYQQDVAAFESVLAPWTARVQATRQRIVALRARLPELVDAALAANAPRPWACLTEHVTAIQQRAADFETVQAHFAAARRRREAEALAAELEAIERDAEERYALLAGQAERLRFLEEDVAHIVTVAADDVAVLAAEDPTRQKRERALSLIAHHTAQAHSAVRYEDASLALSRAADLANRLAL